MAVNNIFLYGPPGSGKTTVGRLLAQSLGQPFLDIDEQIEARTGRAVAEVFAADGEAHFRQLESEVVAQLASGQGQVVSLGGGALLRQANRDRVQAGGLVVRLDCSTDELVRRLGTAPSARPLLAGVNGSMRLERLIAERQAHYQSFPLVVDTTGLSPDDVVAEVQRRVGRLHVRGMGTGYDVIVRRGALAELELALERRGLRPPFVLVADSQVAKLHAWRVLGGRLPLLTFAAGEASKSLATAAELYGQLIAAGLERGGTLIALGGGVTGDLAGFVAATIFRGVAWVNLPSSLLAIVDASLGGKVGVDLAEGKNLVGAFHAPALVVADTDLLATLPHPEFVSGLAEVVKAATIGETRLFELLETGDLDDPAQLEAAVFRAMRVKCRVIEADPYERGERAWLNLGHTVGHAVEQASHYALRHGEAVAIGLVLECRLAEAIGLCAPGISQRVEALLVRLGLPTRPPAMNADIVRGLMTRDKKSVGRALKFALPEAIGRVRAGVDVPEGVLMPILREVLTAP